MEKGICMFGFKKKTRIIYCERPQLPGIDNRELIPSSPIIINEISYRPSNVKWVYIDTVKNEEIKPSKP